MNVDEIYDLLLELELGTPATEALASDGVRGRRGRRSWRSRRPTSLARTDVAETADAAEPSRSTGFGRYRNAALVGAGGLACAAVGALLGGLGGYFTVAPAAAHAHRCHGPGHTAGRRRQRGGLALGCGRARIERRREWPLWPTWRAR